MLRSIVKNDSFLSKKTVLTYKDKKALSQCPSSVISDKANHEELPEIRAQEMKQKLNDSIHKNEKQKSPHPVAHHKERDHSFITDSKVSNVLEPLPNVIKKRKRFA